MPRRLPALASLAVLAVGCGSTSSRSSTLDPTDTLPPAERSDTQPIPSTTTPDPVPAYSCDDPLAIAENLLLERRQGAPVSNCAGPDPWLDSPDDFVDFALDPSEPSSGSVRFVARYRTSDTTSETRAETLRFEPRSDGTWEMLEHGRVEITSELAAARSVANDYFDALATGDHAAAARRLAPTVGFVERPDLDRLETDGLLGERTVDGIAEALAAWCEGGAECRRPDDVQYEITPDHRVRIVATYDVGPTGFEVAFDTDGTSVVGIPPTL